MTKPLPRGLGRETALAARREEIRQSEGPPPGRSGFVTKEDLAATRRRILGLPPEPPIPGVWRW